MHRANKPPLPPGRFWNSASWDTMERTPRSGFDITEDIERVWWPKYKVKLLQPADLTVTVHPLGNDVWCAGWFSHWTFNVGLTDREVLESFERYIDRVQQSGWSESEIGGTLMGAEDRWRWHGCMTGDPQGEKTTPPCHCECCKKNGIIRIDH
jgi:hypothetical protein